MLRASDDRSWLVTIRQFSKNESVVTESLGGRTVPSRMKMIPAFGLSAIFRIPPRDVNPDCRYFWRRELSRKTHSRENARMGWATEIKNCVKGSRWILQ